jgi:polyvinyl alcohol dehydrogenase (cytochrome)
MSRRQTRLIGRLLVTGVIAAPALVSGAAHAADTTSALSMTMYDDAPSWPVAGQNIQNTRFAAAERKIGPGNVSRLRPLWSVSTGGDVAATPTEVDGTVYFPDFGVFPYFVGRLWAVSASTGEVRWSHAISEYTRFAGDSSRSSPAVSGGEVIIGDWTPGGASPVGANIIAVNRDTGRKIWQTQVDSHPAAKITSSPVVFGGTVYVGVSSNEEILSTTPGYVCCTFRGSVVALDSRTGRIRWKAFTVPIGYSGGAVWGSTPAVDPQAGLVYVGTGNNYSTPPGICSAPSQTGCTEAAADDHADAVLALDQATGFVRWAKNTLTGDTYTAICGLQPSGDCGPDFDFGSGPNLITLPSGNRLVGIGQKSGVYWALDPLTGAEVWHMQVGPGGAFSGGIQWGSATDGQRVYAAIGNSNGEAYTITSATGQSSTITGGSWAALDAATGAILWQTADPQGAMDLGFVSAANRVVYAGSTAATGDDMYALDAATGAILWRFASGGSVVSGAAIVNGTVYWGSGYYIASACPGAPTTTQFCPFVPGVPLPGQNNKLYAFAPPHQP